jgi:hypothetical protein
MPLRPGCYIRGEDGEQAGGESVGCLIEPAPHVDISAATR